MRQTIEPSEAILRLPRNRGRALALVLLAALGACTGPDPGELADETRVLVVARKSDPVSQRIADHYARSRSIAPGHVLFLDLPAAETISRSTFEERLVTPLSRWWRTTPPEVRPDFILLTKGIPHRVEGSGGLSGDRASVDSELCDLPSLADDRPPPTRGRRPNPYGRSQDVEFPRFSHRAYGVCLVTRLDGFDEADATALVDRALAAESRFRSADRSEVGASESAPGSSRDRRYGRDGRPAALPRFLLDLSLSPSIGNDWLRSAGERLSDLPAGPIPFAVEVDTSAAFVTTGGDLLGYASWGSNDPRFERRVAFAWVPGALATTFVSSSARTFREPPADWAPGPAGQTEEFEGSRQSLSADWIRSGATGVAGNAFEPYLDACVRPQVLFPAYLAGRTLAESYYLALPYLSWQSVILGDPLCAPFAQPDQAGNLVDHP